MTRVIRWIAETVKRRRRTNQKTDANRRSSTIPREGTLALGQLECAGTGKSFSKLRLALDCLWKRLTALRGRWRQRSERLRTIAILRRNRQRFRALTSGRSLLKFGPSARCHPAPKDGMLIPCQLSDQAGTTNELEGAERPSALVEAEIARLATNRSRHRKIRRDSSLSFSGEPNLHRTSCSTIFPWHDHPFRLISWLEMNKFGATEFYAIGAFFESVSGVITSQPQEVPPEGRERIRAILDSIAKSCGNISLKQSALATKRLHGELGEHMSKEALITNLRSVTQLIHSEMETQLFLWVPEHRSEWFSKDAETILGAECCARFPSAQREVEESAKCYAAGRFTASAFHLTRATEAGVKALAKAINFTPPNDNWTLVFRQMGNEFKLPQTQRPAHWQTHGDFLEDIWADLRAVSKAWRNDIAHLVDTYTEEEAKGLLDVIPIFLRHLATKMDEKGTLY